MVIVAVGVVVVGLRYEKLQPPLRRVHNMI